MSKIKTPKYYHRKRIAFWMTFGISPLLVWFFGYPVFSYYHCNFNVGSGMNCVAPPLVTQLFNAAMGFSWLVIATLPISICCVLATILHSLRCETIVDDKD